MTSADEADEPSEAIIETVQEAGGLSAGLGCAGLDESGELEMLLVVNGHTGSCYISREFWEVVGEHAGWLDEQKGKVNESEG